MANSPLNQEQKLSEPNSLEPLQLSIQHHARVWGGQLLQATNAEQVPIGEAWLVHEHNLVRGGNYDGASLAELAELFGEALLGKAALARTGTRFPLLVKILDCADWLSIQVHPDDAQARELVGPLEFGKTEAWHVLHCDDGAELIAGVQPGISKQQLVQAIRHGGVREISHFQNVVAGDTVMMHAGTMHALGPGMLIYEVQQTSDTTYRVYDWDRPASAGRALHIEQSVTVTNVSTAPVTAMPNLNSDGVMPLVACDYFSLELLQSKNSELLCNTNDLSFHAITISEGNAVLIAGQYRIQLARFDTVVVPAGLGEYCLQGSFKALRSSAP